MPNLARSANAEALLAEAPGIERSLAYIHEALITPGSVEPLRPSRLTEQEKKTINDALLIAYRASTQVMPSLDDNTNLQYYLRLRFAGLTNEEFHVLYLDIDRRLLSTRTEFFGNQRAVRTDIRRIVLHAITLGAEYVVFCHNHPSDDPHPSDADMQHFEWCEKVLSSLDIKLMDSLVVTSFSVTSIVTARKIKEEEKAATLRIEAERRRAERARKIAATKARKAASQDCDVVVPGGSGAPSPIIAQFLAIRAQNPEHLLFYRMGDFYELFFEDAEVASRALGIFLTVRGKHEGRDIPMCGIPIERSEDYLQRLIAQGHKVAICEVFAEGPHARRREVVRLVSPGTFAAPGKVAS
jgi:hypothetical protein